MTELTPLNCSGSSEEEIGAWMSNLQEAWFEFGGETWASVEGLYIALRTLDPEERKIFAGMFGSKAKHKGKKLRQRGLVQTEFMGKSFLLGSDEHHAVIKEAIRAKLTAHPPMCALFVATRPRPIIHDTGFPESRFTQLPASAFCRILTELREELWLAREGKALSA